MGPAALGRGRSAVRLVVHRVPDAFVGTRPVYVEMEAELTEMVGAGPYQMLVEYLRDREQAASGVPLPTPPLPPRQR